MQGSIWTLTRGHDITDEKGWGEFPSHEEEMLPVQVELDPDAGEHAGGVWNQDTDEADQGDEERVKQNMTRQKQTFKTRQEAKKAYRSNSVP